MVTRNGPAGSSGRGFFKIRRAAEASLKRAAVFLEPLEARVLLSESASAQLSLVSTAGSGQSAVYTYGVTLKNTGTTKLGTFWMSWIPGEDFLPTKPLSETSPTGWGPPAIVGSGDSSDGASIQWVAASDNADVAGGASLSGFGFSTHDSPTELAGNSVSAIRRMRHSRRSFMAAPLLGWRVSIRRHAGDSQYARRNYNGGGCIRPVDHCRRFRHLDCHDYARDFRHHAHRDRQFQLQRDRSWLCAASSEWNGGFADVGAGGWFRQHHGHLRRRQQLFRQHVAGHYGNRQPHRHRRQSIDDCNRRVGDNKQHRQHRDIYRDRRPRGSGRTAAHGNRQLPRQWRPYRQRGRARRWNGHVFDRVAGGWHPRNCRNLQRRQRLCTKHVRVYRRDGPNRRHQPRTGKSTLPATAVSGQPTRGVINVSVTNQTAAVVKGKVTVDIFALSNGVIDGSSTLLGRMARQVNIRATKSAIVAVHIKSLPAGLSAGTYTLLARSIDPTANIVDSATGPALQVQAPVISLSESFARLTLPASAVAPGKAHAVASVRISNSGNITSSGFTTIAIYATSDGVVDGNAMVINSITRRLHIRAGKSIVISVPLHQIPSIPAGTYSIVAQVIDPNQQTSSAASGTMIAITN